MCLRPILSLALPFVAAILLAGCGQRDEPGGVLVVSAIEGRGDAAAARLPQRMVALATAQGLVRFDASGGVVPGLAERWTVIDGGTSYIFRLRRATWRDGASVTADDVARSLRRTLAGRGAATLSPWLSSVESVVAMTPEVLELRLRSPRPALLQLLAQPELAIRGPRAPGGSGPWQVLAQDGGGTRLVLPPDPFGELGDDGAPLPQAQVALVHADRAGVAIARFASGSADLVTGGTIADWPLLAAANLPPAAIRIDPAAGIFGLAVERREGFLAMAENRAAVAMAIDRAALVASVSPQWIAAEQLLPEMLDAAAAPATPVWQPLDLVERRRLARARVATWRRDGGDAVTLRVAVPAGPGGRLVFASLAASLASVGIVTERVGPDAPADLRLVDRVAPADIARWYLATACGACSEETEAAVEAARLAPTLSGRGEALARADALVAADTPFVVLARPLRWSLVAPDLLSWQPSARGLHPLTSLAAAPMIEP